MVQGWKDGSVVKTTGCSYRGLRFGSQHPHNIVQPFIILVPGALTPSSGLLRHQVFMWYTNINAGKTHTNKNKNKILTAF